MDTALVEPAPRPCTPLVVRTPLALQLVLAVGAVVLLGCVALVSWEGRKGG